MMHYMDMVLPYFINEEDRSYPHPALSLAWRMDDLIDRLEALGSKGVSYGNRYRLSAYDIRHALAKDLHTLRDVETAIAFAKEDLKDLYGIDANDAQETPPKDAAGHVTYKQLTLYGPDRQKPVSKAQGVA